MAFPRGFSKIAPFWEELVAVGLNKDFLLDLPLEINSADKYRYFLWKTETEIEFDDFLNRFLVEMKHVPAAKVSLILEMIAEHLGVFHQNSGENFQVGVELMSHFFLYTERIFVRKVQRKVKERLESVSVSSELSS
jgi:hypothetical protein